MQKSNTWKKRKYEYEKINKQDEELYCRLKKVMKITEKENIAQQVYVLVYIPMMESFVHWVLKNALKSGKKRLYFLARDGYQPYLIAKRLCEVYEIPIDCRYLSCSRYAWRLPLYAIQEDFMFSYTCMGGIQVTFEKMMKRVGLSEEEAKQIAQDVGMLENYKEPLSYQKVKKLEQPLQECVYFREKVKEHSKKVYEDTIGYLKQEGLLEEFPYAIVDSGWTGSMQNILSILLKSAGKEKEIEGYYFGLYELPKGVKKEYYHTYWFRPKKDRKKKVFFSNCLFETVVSASEGMTIGYEKKDSFYYPVKGVYLNNVNKEQIEQFLNILHYYLEQIGFSFSEEEKREKIVNKLVKLHMSYPTKEEAERMGQMIFSDDVLEYQTQQLATVFTKQELREQNLFYRILNFIGIGKKQIKESAWMEGSIVRSGIFVNYYLFQTRLYKYLIYIKKLFGG